MKKYALKKSMKGLGFTLDTLTGMALSAASARERRAYELNESGIRLANEYPYFRIFFHK